MQQNLQVSKRLENMVRKREELMARTLGTTSQATGWSADRSALVNDRGRMFRVIEVYS